MFRVQFVTFHRFFYGDSSSGFYSVVRSKLLSTFAAAIVYSGLNRAFLFSHRLFCYFDAFGHFFCSAQELTQAENLHVITLFLAD